MNAIDVMDVERCYKTNSKKAFYALKNLSFSVNQGEIFCLLGPNGSGKTTTINLINGLDRPTKGQVRIMGKDPIKEVEAVRSIIGVVPQETALYNDLTARENLLFHAQYYGVPKKKWNSQIDNMLSLVGLTDRQNHKVGTYSGGMQRRLALSRALLTDPQIILLDEPTLGVDVHSKNALWSKIKQLANDGKTIFMTTNYMEEAEALADKIVIIDKGENVVSGTLQELKNSISNNMVTFSFDNERKANEVLNLLSKDFKVSIDNTKLIVNLDEKKQFYSIVNIIGDDIESLNNFSLIEPTLNEIFLHYTGKTLRD